jgi:hypothetical protein
MAKKTTIPSTVKFPPEILEKLKEASELTGLPAQEIIRLCASIGLVHLEKINFKIASAIYHAPVAKPSASDPVPSPTNVVPHPKKKRPLLSAMESPDQDLKAN